MHGGYNRIDAQPLSDICSSCPGQVYKCDVKTGKAEPYVYKPYRRDYAGPQGDGGI